MGFDVEGARKAGYTDAEIASYLAAQAHFDIDGAKSSKYTDSEVIAHLAPKSKATPVIPGSDGDPIEGKYAGKLKPTDQGAPEASMLDKAIGTGEAGLATLSGITGMAGGAVGILQGISRAISRGNFGREEGWKDIHDTMQEYSGALTYQPRTEQGQEQTQAVGNAMAPLVGMAPELGMIGQAAGPALSQLRTGATATLDKAATGVPAALAKVAPEATPGTLGSVGAAGTEMATQRQALATQFEIPPLTKGQATRDPMQLKFERETAKTEAGTPLRERSAEQEAAVRTQLDRWVDESGAEKPLPYDAGMYIDDVLQAQYKRDRAETRFKYTEAGKSKEAQAPIDLNKAVTVGEGDTEATTSVLGYLNSKPTGLPSTGLTDFARQSAVKLGIAAEENGQMRALPATMKQVQDWRREISQNTGIDPTHIQNATVLKRLIDATADPVAGPLYQRARASRIRLAQNYDNHRVISRLLKNKPGTTDRQVAFEDVFDHIVLKGSVDDLQQARRVLQRAKESGGHQAWAEVRGQTLRWVRGQAENFTQDASGNKVISPHGLNKAIETLDAGGSEKSKLMLIFGKKGAQQLRDINDLVQYIKTVPPETALNHSNTAATLSALADGMLMGTTGAPVPLISGTRWAAKYIKDVRLRRRVLESLGEIEAKQAAKPPAAPPPNNSAALH